MCATLKSIIDLRRSSYFCLVWTLCFCHFLDLLELHLPRTCETDFPDQNDLLNFKLNVQPDEVRHLNVCKYFF